MRVTIIGAVLLGASTAFHLALAGEASGWARVLSRLRAAHAPGFRFTRAGPLSMISIRKHEPLADASPMVPLRLVQPE